MVLLNRSERQNIIEILTPHVGTVDARQLLVDSAFLDYPELHREIKLEGTPYEFTTHILIKTLRYGDTDTGKLAIISLLEEIRARVGSANKVKINEYIYNIQTKKDDSPQRTEKDDIKAELQILKQRFKSGYISKGTYESEFNILKVRWKALNNNETKSVSTQSDEQISQSETATIKTEQDNISHISQNEIEVILSELWSLTIMQSVPLLTITIATLYRSDLVTIWHKTFPNNIINQFFPMISIITFLVLTFLLSQFYVKLLNTNSDENSKQIKITISRNILLILISITTGFISSILLTSLTHTNIAIISLATAQGIISGVLYTFIGITAGILLGVNSYPVIINLTDLLVFSVAFIIIAHLTQYITNLNSQGKLNLVNWIFSPVYMFSNAIFAWILFTSPVVTP